MFKVCVCVLFILIWLGVLKCRFYYFSGMMRPTVQKMTVIEKIVCFSSQEEVGHQAI